MARQLTEPGNDRGRGIIRALGKLGVGFTKFADTCGVSFSVWHRIVHSDGDPNVESVILARLVMGGMPLRLVAPTLEKTLRDAGWSPPQSSPVAARERVA